MPTRPAWYEGRFARWLTTTDHKRIGVLYVSTALLWLVLAGIPALIMRVDTVALNESFDSRNSFEVFTAHLTGALFLVVVPIVTGLATFLVPLMIGARTAALPGLAAFAYWLYFLGGVTLFAAIAGGGIGDCAWTCAAPDWTSGDHTGNLWLLALLMLSLASALGAVNVVATIHSLRAEGMTWQRMPLFARAVDVYSWLLIAAVGVLDVVLALLLLDRRGVTDVFGGHADVLRNLLWSFGHPVLYLLVIPVLGIAAEVLRVFPPGRGRPWQRPAHLFVGGAIAVVPIGIAGGILVAALPHNAPVDRDFVRALLDYVVLTGTLLVLLGGLHYWWPKLFGRLLGERLARWSFWFVFAGLNLAFFPAYLHTASPVYAYPHHAGWGTYQVVSAVGLGLLTFGVLLFLVNVLRAHVLHLGRRASNDPWLGDTLEWYTTSPPPPHNFDRLPPIASGRPLRDLRRTLRERNAL
jgi:heme/copper-type cytochrome/quinol oxidase subunit 1